MSDPFTWAALITSAVGANVAANRMPNAPEKSIEEMRNEQAIAKDRFEDSAEKNKAIVRSMRASKNYGSQFSLLNPNNNLTNNKLGN